MDLLCYKITAVLTADTPLHIGSGQRTGVIKRTFRYIPGSTLRGAVGSSLMKAVCKLSRPLVNHEECEHFGQCPYTHLFGEEFGKTSNVFFRYAYPLHVKCGGVFHPAPKTMYVCKNQQCRKTYDKIFPPSRCEEPMCKDDVARVQGFVCNSCHEFCEHPVELWRTTSTAIDRRLDSAAQVGENREKYGTLHTTEIIKKGSKFAVEVLASKEAGVDVDLLRSTLERSLEDEGIGGGKSRGLGKVKVDNLRIAEVDEDSIQKRATEIGALIAQSSLFSVRLVSPMVLEEPLGSTSLLEGCRRSYTWLFHMGKPSLPEVQLQAARTEREAFTGWSLKMQRRRAVEAAFSAGSVFQFKAQIKDELLPLSLAALELHAIGSYKPHGCGQMAIESSR